MMPMGMSHAPGVLRRTVRIRGLHTRGVDRHSRSQPVSSGSQSLGDVVLLDREGDKDADDEERDDEGYWRIQSGKG